MRSPRTLTAGNKLNHLWAVVRNDKFAFTSRPIPATSFCVVSVSWWETVRKQLLEKQSTATVIFLSYKQNFFESMNSFLQMVLTLHNRCVFFYTLYTFYTLTFYTQYRRYLFQKIKSTWVNFHEGQDKFLVLNIWNCKSWQFAITVVDFPPTTNS